MEENGLIEEQALNPTHSIFLALVDENGEPLEFINVTFKDSEGNENTILSNSHGTAEQDVYSAGVYTYTGTDLMGRFPDISGSCSTVPIEIGRKYYSGQTLTEEELSQITVHVMRKKQTLAESVEKIMSYKDSIISLYRAYCIGGGVVTL